MSDVQIPIILESLFRWTHIVAGILWIGLLYFFNFVNSAFAAARFISALTLATTAAGVRAGPKIPYQLVLLKPGKSSATAGMSGSERRRFGCPMPIARTLPAAMCASFSTPIATQAGQGSLKNTQT